LFNLSLRISSGIPGTFHIGRNYFELHNFTPIDRLKKFASLK
jgi:hypothetical protein